MIFFWLGFLCWIVVEWRLWVMPVVMYRVLVMGLCVETLLHLYCDVQTFLISFPRQQSELNALQLLPVIQPQAFYEGGVLMLPMTLCLGYQSQVPSWAPDRGVVLSSLLLLLRNKKTLQMVSYQYKCDWILSSWNCSVVDVFVRWLHSKIFSAMAVSLTSSAIVVSCFYRVEKYVDFFLSPLPSWMVSFVPREVLFADAADTEDRILCSARRNSARCWNSRVTGNASEDFSMWSSEIHGVFRSRRRSQYRRGCWCRSGMEQGCLMMLMPSCCQCLSYSVFAIAYPEFCFFSRLDFDRYFCVMDWKGLRKRIKSNDWCVSLCTGTRIHAINDKFERPWHDWVILASSQVQPNLKKPAWSWKSRSEDTNQLGPAPKEE